MTITTFIPKRILVNAILEIYSQDEICNYFHIGREINLQMRLNDFSVNPLYNFLVKSELGEIKLKELEKLYPLRTGPTLYLILINHYPEFTEIIDKTTNLAELDRRGGLEFGDSRAVRIVYTDKSSYMNPIRNDTLEIPLKYERRFEYNIGDPSSDNYGKHVSEYSLEEAFFWLIKAHSYGILYCSDYAAVRPIINYASTLIDVRFGLPYLTEEMFTRLASNAHPRSATFSKIEAPRVGEQDVKTIVLSDPFLGERNRYKEISNDDLRDKISGFFSNHPSLPFGGLGISRRYGRIWTPVHISRENLLNLSIGLINNTETVLSKEYGQSTRGYVSVFREIQVDINNKTILGKKRKIFDTLITAIIEASKHNNAYDIPEKLINELVRYQKQLNLIVSYEFECPECGVVMGICPECHLPYTAKMDNDELLLVCPMCQNGLDIDFSYLCECGTNVHAHSLYNHIRILPEIPFLDSIQKLFNNQKDFTWNGSFIVSGHNLKIFNFPNPPIQNRIRLDDLRYWRVTARYHLRAIPVPPKKDTLIKILNRTKEKCNINNYHPNYDIDCVPCLARQITAPEIEQGLICLPRILGIPINHKFDGKHHRYEIADVMYNDIIDNNDKPVNIGIHLKSRLKKFPPEGAGRSTVNIKGLYTQIFYTAYQILNGTVNLDLLGISIPNYFRNDVISSIQELLNKLGLTILVLDEEDWLKILEISIEQLQF